MSAVAIVEVDAEPTIVVRLVTAWSELATVIRSSLDEAYAVLRAAGLHAPGDNIVVYLDDQPAVEIGVTLAGHQVAVPSGSPVEHSTLPAGRAAHAVHRGGYERLGETHRAVLDWCRAEGVAPTGVRWEVYGDWAEDPAQLTTDVFYLLA